VREEWGVIIRPQTADRPQVGCRSKHSCCGLSRSPFKLLAVFQRAGACCLRVWRARPPALRP
jgi:hypothetical protein